MTLSLRSVLSRKSTPYVLTVVLGACAIAYALYAGPNSLEKARLAARYTARAAFLFFIVTYTSSALVRLWPNPMTLAIMRNRLHWGTAFALSMAIQVAAFSPFVFMANNGETAQRLYIGTVGLFIILAMAVTPLKGAARAGNLVWTKRLHRVGMHMTWVPFVMQYQYYVTHGIRELVNVPLLMLCFVILGIRIAAWTKTRAKKYRTAAANTATATTAAGI